MKTREIIDLATTNYIRNLPLQKVNKVSAVNEAYKQIVTQVKPEEAKITLRTTFDGDTNLILPENFFTLEVDINSIPAITIENDLENIVEIISQTDIPYYSDDENVDEEVSYFTIETHTDTDNTKRMRLTHQFGDEFPSGNVTLVYLRKPETLGLEDTPELVIDTFHEVIVFQTALKLVSYKDLSDNERITYQILNQGYEDAKRRYLEFNNDRNNLRGQ